MLLKIIYNYLNQIFWKAVYEHPSLIKYKHTISKPFENEILSFEDDDINKSFEKDNKEWYHNELVYKIDKVLIEPSNHILIKGFRTLIKESFQRANDRPSLLQYLKYRFFNKKKRQIHEAVMFDGTVGTNYFHFFSDVINKLWLLENYIELNALPLIISSRTFNTTYFQYFYNNSYLKCYNWHVQNGNEWFMVEHLWIVKPYAYKIEYWIKTINILNLNFNAENKRIFINRSKNVGRYIKNFEEIKGVLNKFHFEIVDTSALSFEEQINLFSSSEIVIGIHGAGNTNMVFTNYTKVKFIEIMPSDRISCHYYWLSESLNICYDVVKAGCLDKDNGFIVDKTILEKSIKKLI